MSDEQAKSKIRVAMIGCGVIARQHAARLKDDERVEIAVVFDPNAASAERLRDEFAPQAAIAPDERAAIVGRPLEAAIVSSPTQRHFEHASLVLDHGLHLLCEKPLAGDRGQILDLIARSRDSQRIFSISHQRRYKAAYRTARRELTERADWYGRVRSVHIYSCERWQQTIAGTWRDDPAVGAGYFGDAGIHQVDVVNFIADLRAERLVAHSVKRASRVEIVTGVLADMTGGVGLTAHFVGDAQHWREDIHFHCERADLLLRSEEVFRAKENQLEKITDLEPASSPDHAFIDAIVGGPPVVSPPEIALPIYDWTQAVLRSAREGGWVKVGP